MTHSGLDSGRDPARFAFVLEPSGESLSYGELERRSRLLAAHLRRSGLRRGDHVALLLRNGLDYPVAAWAAQRSGLYYTPVNYQIAKDEVAYIVRDCDARALISAEADHDVAKAIAADNPQIVACLTTGPGDARFVSLEAIYAREYAGGELDECEGEMMLYSSGTTGRPKGIVRPASFAPWGTPTRTEQMIVKMYGMDADTVLLMPAPMYHAAPLGWAMAAVRRGATVVAMAKFDAEQALDAIERNRVSHVQMVPTMFVRLLGLDEEQRRRRDLVSLRFVVHAGAPCPVDLKQRMIGWLGPVIHEYYAGSEGNGSCSVTAQEWLLRPGTVGRPVVGHVHILDDAQKELPPGEIGMIYFGGLPPVQYHKDPERSRSVLSEQGYTTLGDYGWVDADGYVFIADRRTDLIISGGVNIYPRETEEVLQLHPAVLDAAVIGVPSAEFGQDVLAVVELRPGMSASESLGRELIGFSRERMAHFKCPKRVVFDELPRTATGKLLRRKLKDQYAPG